VRAHGPSRGAKGAEFLRMSVRPDGAGRSIQISRRGSRRSRSRRSRINPRVVAGATIDVARLVARAAIPRRASLHARLRPVAGHGRICPAACPTRMTHLARCSHCSPSARSMRKRARPGSPACAGCSICRTATAASRLFAAAGARCLSIAAAPISRRTRCARGARGCRNSTSE
jgi:hypothetical protein